jgi:uncharacterized Zn-binding protein involved in type VI secretion
MTSGLFLHLGATIKCPHGGQVSSITSNTKVLVAGQPVLNETDTFNVSGCFFTVGNKAQPCVILKQFAGTTRVLINGQRVVVQDGSGICQSAEQIPQGAPNVVTTQIKTKGS